MNKLELAESFAKDISSSITSSEERISHSKHLENVVNRLKGLGITDENSLCAAWLHEVIEDGRQSFDELFQLYGRKVAIYVSTLSKDRTLAKKDRELHYVNQIKDSPFEVKIILLCDIAATLKELETSKLSKSAKTRLVKQKRYYLSVIKKGFSANTSNPDGISRIFDGINQVLIKYRQNPI